jgi:hypothetical protein
VRRGAFCQRLDLPRVRLVGTEPSCGAGPEIDIIFSGGACLLNETDFLAGNGSLAVDCIAPSVTIDILPASLTSKYTSAVEFTDKVLFNKSKEE